MGRYALGERASRIREGQDVGFLRPEVVQRARQGADVRELQLADAITNLWRLGGGSRSRCQQESRENREESRRTHGVAPDVMK